MSGLWWCRLRSPYPIRLYTVVICEPVLSAVGWTTALGLSISWMWYLSSGNLPILSKQSLYSSNTVDFERLITKVPGFSWGRAWGVQGSSMFTVVMIISCSSRQLIMDGWPGASTILNFVEAELPLKVILKAEIPKSKMVFPPLFTEQHCRAWSPDKDRVLCRSPAVEKQVSAPESTFTGMQRVSLLLTLGVNTHTMHCILRRNSTKAYCNWFRVVIAAFIIIHVFFAVYLIVCRVYFLVSVFWALYSLFHLSWSFLHAPSLKMTCFPTV